MNAGSKEHPVIQNLSGDMLQLQTAINPANSGGPVLDDNGNIVGIVSFTDTSMQNVSFASAASEIAGLMQRRDQAASKSPLKSESVAVTACVVLDQLWSRPRMAGTQ
jgi:S1-C subfamily serine protease